MSISPRVRIFIFLTVLFGLLDSALAEPAPDWVLNLTPGHWSAVSLNTLEDLDPEDIESVNPNFPLNAPWHGASGQTSVMDSWTGGAFASGYGAKGSLLLHGGGNNSYYGSEVYAFDLASRLWTRATDPFPGPINFPYDAGVYPDGSPVPTHTYDYLEYHPGTNSFVVFSGNRDASQRTWVTNEPRAYTLDLNSKTWRHSQRVSEGGIRYGGMSCFDRNRDVFWILGEDNSGASQSHFIKFDPDVTSGDPFTYYRGQLFSLDSVSICDPINDLFIYASFRPNNKQVMAKDLSSPESSAVQLIEAGNAPQKKGQSGWEWSDRLRAIIYWIPGSGVYQLKQNGSNWETDSWEWLNLTAPDNTVMPDDTKLGGRVYSKFRLATYDNAEVAIVATRIDRPVYAFRLPDPTNSDTTTPQPPNNLRVSPRG